MVEGRGGGQESDIIDALMFGTRRRSRSSSSSRSSAKAVGKDRRANSRPGGHAASPRSGSELVDARRSLPDPRQGSATAALGGEERAWSRTLTLRRARRRKFAESTLQGRIRRAQATRSSPLHRFARRSASTAASPARPSAIMVSPSSPRARLGAVPARRDAGDRHHDARHRRATSRRSTPHGRALEALPPTTTSRPSPPARPSRMRGPGRREIGHGALAERALVRMMPRAREVPVHDPRRVRDTESNGSSSMASVCGGSPRSWTRAFRSRPRSPASRWASSRTGEPSPSPTSSATRTTSATWTSRSAAPPTASPPSRWTSRSPA